MYTERRCAKSAGFIAHDRHTYSWWVYWLLMGWSQLQPTVVGFPSIIQVLTVICPFFGEIITFIFMYDYSNRISPFAISEWQLCCAESECGNRLALITWSHLLYSRATQNPVYCQALTSIICNHGQRIIPPNNSASAFCTYPGSLNTSQL